MQSSLAILVPTCGRPEKLQDCIRAIRDTANTTHEIVVLDSDPNSEIHALYETDPGIRVIRTSTVVGPGEARQILIQHLESEFALFLDDDLVPLPGAIDKLYGHILSHPDEIFSGVWREGEGYREAGQLFIEGISQDGQPVITKKFVSIEDCRALGLESLRVDGVMASMIISRSNLDIVGFDRTYQFFFELFDFFLSCREAGVAVNVLPAVEFEHRPGGYQRRTKRDLDKNPDRESFESKWNTKVIGDLGGETSRPPRKNRRFKLKKRHFSSGA